ncbi:UDP-N-acetylglucosamine 2-epimerase (non-hydrolyzing) [Notoacmeibacter marinus]|uniref:UDP-N-acetylglucosamine 2-epimerase (Non-hydrolyzing) n=1 Tax=Notoacmeibacter marinus TaxID=1876515 RepID=A0A231UU29_9HYPH|nr:UDP-N-acetylglucosamine 2-epimerase (non-hydrolyzing) [Notoacmeibacter marinus]OXS99396.1 UDP-N-acetylglucosamine 2-epimerase (non-hydrolyzing) [Notoacmeibacter marinus]
MSKTVMTVIGARPQFIKAATTSRAFLGTEGIDERIVHTGQHYDDNMSAVFFEELGIPAPHHHLGIGGGGHGAMTGRMLEALERVMLDERPDLVLLFGDTNSTLAGALAAAKLHVPVAHVEAGLRSFNRRMPEEINRILTDHCSALLFPPTATGTTNLKAEGIAGDKVIEVGDVMYDAALMFGELVERRGSEHRPSGDYVLATVHRQENTDDPARLDAIIDGLAEVSEQIAVVLPLHPRTAARIGADRRATLPENFRVIDPVGYLDMVALQKGACVIATDSGGVQKEAFFHGVPAITLRDETEWTELIDSGWNRLVTPTSSADVREAILAMRCQKGEDMQPYGDGDAAGKIVAAIEKALA